MKLKGNKIRINSYHRNQPLGLGNPNPCVVWRNRNKRRITIKADFNCGKYYNGVGRGKTVLCYNN